MPSREGCRLPLNEGLLPANQLAQISAHLLRSSPITGPSLLLRGSPPLSGASVLSASRLEPLAPFPLASPARFSRSIQEPGRESRRLHAGCHLGSLRHPSSLSRRTGHPSVLTSSKQISTLLQ